MRFGLALVLWTGCFHPTTASGVPCAGNGDCPSGQTCDLATTICMTGTPTGIDAPRSTDGAIDAPPIQCALGCPASEPVCDPGSTTCRGCIADVECPSLACVEFQGRCAAETEVVYVTPTGTGDCTKLSPCGLNNAGNRVTATRSIIRLADGTYADQLRTMNGPSKPTVIVSGEDLDPAGATIATTNGASVVCDGITVLEGFTVTAATGDGIRPSNNLTAFRMFIHDTNQAGIDVVGGTVHLYDSTIARAKLRGIYMNNGGTLDLQRSQIFNSSAGGIFANNALVTITSSVIAENGNGSTTGGIELVGALPGSHLAFVTLANNAAVSSKVGGLESDAPVPVDSSIVSMNGIPGLCGTCDATYTMFGLVSPSGTGNFTGMPMFVGAGDYHIKPTSPARGMAAPVGNPPDDLDGEHRPLGNAPDCGADEIP